MKYRVYRLIHNGVVVYVGITKLTLKRRKNGNYKNTCVENIHRECDIELIEETDDISRERYWIDYHRDTILNILDGDGVDRKEYMRKYEKEKHERLEQYRLERKEAKKEYDRQRYINKKLKKLK